MDWRRAESGLWYRIARSGEIVAALGSGVAVLAAWPELVYRRGDVDCSLAATGRGVVGRWLNGARRRSAGIEARVSRSEGAGEVGFAPARPGEVSAVELRRSVADVVCQADVTLVRQIPEAGSPTKLAMIPLTGEGVAFLCADGTPIPVEFKTGRPWRPRGGRWPGLRRPPTTGCW